MAAVCEQLDEFKTPYHLLISSFFGEQIMLATPLLQWYIKHGLVIINITVFIHYEPVPCFKEFTKKVADARRALMNGELAHLKVTHKS